MEPIRADPSPAPRLQNWVRAEQVIDGATVDVERLVSAQVWGSRR